MTGKLNSELSTSSTAAARGSKRKPSQRVSEKASTPKDSVELGPKRSFPGAANDIPASPYSWATGSATKLLQEAPEGSEAAKLAGLHTGQSSFPKARRDFQQKIARDVKKLAAGGLDVASLEALLANPGAATPRRLYEALANLGKQHPENKKLIKLRDLAGSWQATEDFTKIKADGLMRTAEHYLSPGHLTLAMAARGWDVDKVSGLSIADAVVIGGGPGGLATTYHLAEDGRHVVLLEGGKIGQGFADAHAQSVHQLRTNGDASNLIYTGSQTQLGVDVSMPRHLEKSRQKCQDARQDWSQATGETQQGYSSATGGERVLPANRAELFDHMVSVAAGLTQHYPDTFVSESSPVSSLEKVDRDGQTLFVVTTEKGHKMMTRSLVMATGFVGSDGEHARCLKAFDAAPSALVMCNDNDLFGKGDDLLRLERGLQSGKVRKNLVMSERMLGRPELREMIKDLPEGTRIGVIGGGESASKGALEVLALNQHITLDLYTSAPLEPYQTQVPTSVIHPAVVEKAIVKPEVAERTWAETENFET